MLKEVKKIVSSVSPNNFKFDHLGLLYSAVACCMPSFCIAEETRNNQLNFSTYIETYYSRDFNYPSNNMRPFFTYSHNRANDLSINLAMFKTALQVQNYRANLALGSGTYMRANYAAEPDGLQNLYEANAGIKLSSERNIWLDVGVMSSHLGFESAIGVENWTMTRSLMAENSPYFETGAKVSYSSDDGKWYASGLLLTGWQRIKRTEGNTTPAIGHQLTYKPNSTVTLNSSSFVGNDKSDRDRQMRYFHDFYGQFKLSDKWGLITAFDIGAEEKPLGSGGGYYVWFAPAIIARYQVSDQLGFSARWEYFQDIHGVIVNTGTTNGFRTHGYSINVDYKVCPQITLRAEARKLNSKDDIFDDEGARLKNSNMMIATAFALQF
jgi:hypothetical protein